MKKLLYNLVTYVSQVKWLSEQIFCPICGKKLIVSKKGRFWDDYYFLHDRHKIAVKIYKQTNKASLTLQIPKEVIEAYDKKRSKLTEEVFTSCAQTGKEKSEC